VFGLGGSISHGAVNSVGHLAEILSLWFGSSSVWRNGSFVETRLQ
jgi:hypothetical protein